MLWLDSTYPAGSSKLGAARGSCATTSGVPSDLEKNVPNSAVSFSNIKFGPIGTTYSSTGSTDPTTPTDPTDPPVAHWGQCGGQTWTGSKTCVSPYTCTKVNDFYSQCL